MQWGLLGVLDDDQRREVVAAARRRKFARNEVVFHEGDLGDTLHLIVKGHAAVRITTPLGDIATLLVLKPGDCFGELAVVSPAARNATVVALDALETLSLHRDQFAELRARVPDIGAILIEALVEEVRRLSGLLVEAMYVPVERRVWRRLADLVDVYSGEGDVTTIAITQEDLAQLAGTTRPTVNRVLRGGEERGIVAIARGRIEVLDRAALEREAR